MFNVAIDSRITCSILIMVMNTISSKGPDFILHAEEKGRGRIPDSSRGSGVLNFAGSVGEYSSNRLVYENKRHFA
jgi:hypothetical protein